MANSVVTVEKMSNANRGLNVFKWIDKWILEGLEKFIVSFGLLSLSTVVFGIVITRYFFGFSPDWSDELPRFMVVWITFIGMSYCIRKGEHVVIDILFNKLNIKIKKAFHLIILSICFLFFIYLTYIGFNMTFSIFNANQMSVTMGIPLGYVFIAVPLGCFLSAKNLLHIIIRNLLSSEIYTDLKEGGDQ